MGLQNEMCSIISQRAHTLYHSLSVSLSLKSITARTLWPNSSFIDVCVCVCVSEPKARTWLLENMKGNCKGLVGMNTTLYTPQHVLYIQWHRNVNPLSKAKNVWALNPRIHRSTCQTGNHHVYCTFYGVFVFSISERSGTQRVCHTSTQKHLRTFQTWNTCELI